MEQKTKAFGGMLAQEKAGVQGSRWLIYNAGELHIVGIKQYTIMSQELKDSGVELVQLTTEQAGHVLRHEIMHLGHSVILQAK